MNEQFVRIHPAEGLGLEQAERRPVRQHQPPGLRRDPREGAAGRPPSVPALFARERRTARRSRSCSRSCWRSARKSAEYDAWLIKISEGDQFGSGFVAINPNSKIPALVDRSGPKPIRVFESGAILLHLAEKFGAFLPTEPAERAECFSWLFWQMGSAPYLGGGFGHFYAYAPIKIEYAIDRFAMETKRLLDVLDRRLAESEYVAGRDYTIADMAIWPWYGGLARGGQLWGGRILERAGLQERPALGGCDRRSGPRSSVDASSTGPSPAIPQVSCTERHDAERFRPQDAGQALGRRAAEARRLSSRRTQPASLIAARLARGRPDQCGCGLPMYGWPAVK